MNDIFPPKCKQIPHIHSIHKDQREDPFFWLNDKNNPDVIQYLEEENKYTQSKMKHTESFQTDLFQEMKNRIKQTDESLPYKSNGYWYYTRYETGKEYPIYCRKLETLESEEIIILDVNILAEGLEFIDVSGLSISPNNQWLAYGVDTLSRRIYTIHFKNLITGALLDFKIENTSGSCTWANDNETIFYSEKDLQTLRTFQIINCNINTKLFNTVYIEHDETFYTYVYKSKSKQYIIIGSNSTLTSEYRYIKADAPLDTFKIFNPRIRGHEYGITHFKDHFYIVSNWEAQNFKLMRCPLDQTEQSYWEEVIPHQEDTLLEGVDFFNEYMVIDQRYEGLTHLIVKNTETQTQYEIDFGETSYSAGLSVNPDFDTYTIRYSYTSLTTPNSSFEFNLITQEKTLLKEQEVVGGYDKHMYESKRLYAISHDGVEVPISIVYKKGISLNGKNPTLLYGYGSYGATMDVYFSSVRLSLLDRGFIFAIAHIRGGQEKGRYWYEDGKLLKKKNTFLDFIACAEHLIAMQYSNPQHLYAMGGSAGGLLMGAVINMKPELWRGIVAQVPFVDVVTTMLDESIPLTTGEFDEWGNPKEEAYYHYMKSYSPIDNIEAKNYPNMLVTTGLHDSQVQYWEPAKWVAKLRAYKTDNNIILLQTNMSTGHGGASGRFERLKEIALEYAFLFDLEGITK